MNVGGLNKSVSLLSNESEVRSMSIPFEENKFIFSFLTMTLKKGVERSRNDLISELRQKGES